MLSVILVEPEREINVGMVARVMKNTGFSDLIIINPKCKIGKKALMFSKHGSDVLKNAKIFKTINSAVRNFDYVIGTTGVVKRHKKTDRAVIPLQKFLKRAGPYLSRRTAIVFGREGIGLTSQEIDLCDLLLSIEANPSYPVFNISHAAAIILYSLSQNKNKKPTGIEPLASKEERKKLELLFRQISSCYPLRNPRRVNASWKKVLSKSMLTEKEARSLLKIFRLISDDISKIKKH
ncbi:MAG: RNA methyltransferase [Candidatus Anstonellales archaeon]